MSKDQQHAAAVTTIPAGFSGWWCQRCEKPQPGIPEEAGSPARCPHCRKYTAVWIPPSPCAPREESPGPNPKAPAAGLPEPEPAPVKYLSGAESKRWFEEIHRVIDNPEPENNEP